MLYLLLSPLRVQPYPIIEKREHVASAVERKSVIFWKDINEARLKSDDIPKLVIGYILNVARITEFMYANFEDKYTNCEFLKD